MITTTAPGAGSSTRLTMSIRWDPVPAGLKRIRTGVLVLVFCLLAGAPASRSADGVLVYLLFLVAAGLVTGVLWLWSTAVARRLDMRRDAWASDLAASPAFGAALDRLIPLMEAIALDAATRHAHDPAQTCQLALATRGGPLAPLMPRDGIASLAFKTGDALHLLPESTCALATDILLPVLRSRPFPGWGARPRALVQISLIPARFSGHDRLRRAEMLSQIQSAPDPGHTPTADLPAT